MGTVENNRRLEPLRQVSESLTQRPRRLRYHPLIRDMVRETSLSPSDFVYPMFVHHGRSLRREVPSLPGVYQYSVDQLAAEATEVAKLGIRAVILFGIPEAKDAIGSDACSPDGIICQAIREIKNAVDDLLVISDVCFCEYTDHGHCGPLLSTPNGPDVDNDATLERLSEQVRVQAAAGVDVVAPSGMMDGFVAAIRRSLDQDGYSRIPIMAYSAKYASAFYGPFRDAAASAPQFGDRRSYQMDPANRREAIREVLLDVEQGADIVMVKPALSYLDVIREVRDTVQIPVAAYNVSGEYAMVKAASANGWIDERRLTLEILMSMKRAGADIIISYHAKDACRWLEG